MPAAIDRASAIELRARCRRDPSYFSRAVLRERLWSKQIAVKRSVRDHRRTVVRSGHAVGKSRVLAELICEHMAFEPRANVICTASTNPQVQQVLWAQVERLYWQAARNGVPLGGRLIDCYWQGAQADSFAVAKSVDDPTAMHGVHGPAVLIVVDEGEGVKREMWRAIESLMSSGGAKLVVAYNPWDAGGYCEEMANRPDFANLVEISCLEHPNVVSGENIIAGAVTKEWVDEIERTHGVDSPEYQVMVTGKAPKAGSRQLVSREQLEACEALKDTGVSEEPRAGLDVAAEGKDLNVCVVFDAQRRMVACESWHESDTMKTVRRALDMAHAHKARLRVDKGGVGAPIVHRMRELGERRVIPVDFGEGVQNDWRAATRGEPKLRNRKAELYWIARHLVRERLISIPRNVGDGARVWSDLIATQYDHESDGTWYVLEKKAMRKLIGRSPDHGDAVAIAMAKGPGSEFRF